MKRLLVTSTVAVLMANGSIVSAGNIEAPVVTAPPTAPVFVPDTYSNDWSGFYAGGSIGFADVDEDAAAFVDSGATYGVHGGYDYDFGDFVIGGELELSGFDVSNGGTNVDSVARAKVRAGYDAGSYLPYVTVGVAQLSTGGALTGDDTGPVYGLGMDYRLTDDIRLGGEILKHEFNNFDGSGLDLDATTAAVRMAFEF